MDCNYSPDMAAITNLSPNHLDIHKDMEEYIDSKKNIFKHQGKDGVLILNKDNEITYSMREDTSSEVRMFSIRSNDVLTHLRGITLLLMEKKCAK
jgi:UDP-N-acetylmuramoylalanine--D-glutamate ligase